jgi:hypothetical protein
MTFEQARLHVGIVIRSTHLPGWKENREAWEVIKASIHQNAEDAKRLKALEKAMEEWGEKKYVPAVDDLCVRWLRLRADEILREGEPHDQD